jgi:VCBS repeat protein
MSVKSGKLRVRLLSAAVALAAVMGLPVGASSPAFAVADSSTSPGIGFTPFGVADWDDDGLQDMIARQDSTGELWLYPGVGAGLSSSPIRIGTNFQGYTPFGLADWDGDGHTDLVIRNDTSGDLIFYTGHGGRAELTGDDRVPLGANFQGYTSFGLADWDGDGHTDLIIRQDSDGELLRYAGHSRRSPLVAADRIGIGSVAPGPTFAITSDGQQDLFITAVGTPNAVITVAGNVDLDLSGQVAIPVAPGVRLIGDRTGVRKGPRSFTTTFPSVLLTIGTAR